MDRMKYPDWRMDLETKKLINLKKYIMKDKKITEMEIKEIKKELLKIQRSHLNESKGS
jgi:hypothetical protein